MDIIYTKHALADKKYWQQYNPKIAARIETLITNILAHPFDGIGRPEPLRFNKSGYWSRRINREHRLVYKIADDILYIAQCRYHYERP